MIIDCHGHYTTAPAAHDAWRAAQLEAFNAGKAAPAYPSISDDEIRESLSAAQLRIQKERGIDLTIFSPKASAMGHHLGDLAVSREWTRHSNNLIHRVCRLFPDRFVGVCQLPQSQHGTPSDCIEELERCVTDLGFVGCNLNPDVSGGNWTGLPLTDEIWFPLYEKMVELDVPAMIHVSGSCNCNFHTTGAHYINADTTVFMQLISGNLFEKFPKLKFIIPHGGGAVPYHWGRYRGLAQELKQPPLAKHLLKNVFFDTCVYHQPGIDLLTKVVPIDNILFATEMMGAVKGIDPETSRNFDDTGWYLNNTQHLQHTDRAKIFEQNARRVYGRLSGQILAQAY
ncbi:4-oxalomesaconate hydratase [Rhizobium sp. J15]|uniref:amidohydrolase family protein n=1 Tax=Rhizobium sp. J15 TaxID=2035450 RepID=UPI000BE7E05D|nr:amidohydrolase family protein [Rhizobium sp. J15]PDT16805.1 4-oxalomesaconate hydratase [Rhizobium sp. J15]